jgi:1,4-dihydroxy-6-naphthoate synthase
MKLSLGFSPCPNDTFIFDALVNNQVDLEGLQFEVIMEDIETLNRWASEGKLDISKLSFPAFFPNLHQYTALPSGAALGKGVGPLVVARNRGEARTDCAPEDDLDAGFTLAEEALIAIPGENTTANFLLSYFLPASRNKRIAVLFSEIEQAVISGKADIGLLIHENRFTYAERGLIKMADLGKLWEKKTGLPTPLACIAIKRTIDVRTQQLVGRLIRKSLEYSFENYPHISPFVELHAQAMSKDVMRKHIDLYVNDYSIDLGEAGRKAIRAFYDIYRGATEPVSDLFVN